MQIHFLLKAQGWEGAAYGHSLSPPPHAKPGKPAGKATARGIKPHVMFSYVWIYGSKMCTLHTNVSSKTPSRSPQGSAHPVCGWRRRPECLAKIEFLNPANFFPSVMIVIGATMKNRIGTTLLLRLASFHIRWAQSLFATKSHFLFSSNSMRVFPLLETVGAVAGTHFCLFTIICPSIPLNKGFPSIQMVILPPEPLSRFWNFESEIVPAIAIMTVAGEQGEGGWG